MLADYVRSLIDAGANPTQDSIDIYRGDGVEVSALVLVLYQSLALSHSNHLDLIFTFGLLSTP